MTANEDTVTVPRAEFSALFCIALQVWLAHPTERNSRVLEDGFAKRLATALRGYHIVVCTDDVFPDVLLLIAQAGAK